MGFFGVSCFPSRSSWALDGTFIEICSVISDDGVAVCRVVQLFVAPSFLTAINIVGDQLLAITMLI